MEHTITLYYARKEIAQEQDKSEMIYTHEIHTLLPCTQLNTRMRKSGRFQDSFRH